MDRQTDIDFGVQLGGRRHVWFAHRWNENKTKQKVHAVENNKLSGFYIQTNKSSHINVVNKTKEKIHQTKTCATRVIMVVVLFFYKQKKEICLHDEEFQHVSNDARADHYQEFRSRRQNSQFSVSSPPLPKVKLQQTKRLSGV